MSEKKIEEILRQARIDFARKGGLASARKKTPQQRRRLAENGAKARWSKRKAEAVA